MTGDIKLEKADSSLNNFLAALDIVDKNGGSISRQQFINEISSFAQLNSSTRTPFNKSKFPCYFGFLLYYDDVLHLTSRGCKALAFLRKTTNPTTGVVTGYFVDPLCMDDFRRLFVEAIFFDTIGKNNTGVPTSKSDVEPAQIMFRLLKAFQSVSAEEIAFSIFAINDPQYASVKTMDDAISFINRNRSSSVPFDYLQEIRKLRNGGATISENVIADIKLAKDLCVDSTTRQGLDVLVEGGGAGTKKTFSFKYPNHPALDSVSALKGYHTPHRMVVDSLVPGGAISFARDTIAGGTLNNAKFVVNKSHFGTVGNPKSIFEMAVAYSFENPTINTFVIFDDISVDDVATAIGTYWDLLEPVDDLYKNDNGWSASSIQNKLEVGGILSQSNMASEYFKDNGCLRLPDNFNVLITTN